MLRNMIRSESSVPAKEVERAKRTYIQWLISREDGAMRYEMRKFVILPGGEIPPHLHPDVEHEQYVLRGKYLLLIGGEEKEVKQGDVVFIPPNTIHGYRNLHNEPAEFLCIIPKVDRYETIWVEDIVKSVEKGERGPPSRC